MKQGIQPVGLARPSKPYSPVVVSEDLVFVSGQIPIDASGTIVPGGFEEQVRQVFENLRLCLDAAECELDDVVRVTAYLTDRDVFGAFNELYVPYFQEPRPVRTTILCGLLDERFLFEMDVVARRP